VGHDSSRKNLRSWKKIKGTVELKLLRGTMAGTNTTVLEISKYGMRDNLREVG